MGFLAPRLPDLDYSQWRTKGRMERIKPMVQDWAVHGFGTPEAVFLLYLAKIAAYIIGCMLAVSLTDGIDGLGGAIDAWASPIAFQKVVVFTLLFEVLGFGCGFGPLTMRFNPPIGGFLYWLRPGTIRLPAFPKIPLTAGTTRRVVDVVLYIGIVLTCSQLLLSDPDSGEGLVRSGLLILLTLLVVMGLRDKTIFLAARTEVYGTLILTFFLAGDEATLAAKLVVFLIWWGAAFSKLNRHFPSVITVMLSNSPVIRSARLKRRLFVGHPDDIRPSVLATRIAHGGTVFEFVVPAVLLLSRGGPVTTIAAIAMIAFHVFIISSIPMGVPLEWNVFMIYAIGVLFVENAAVGLGAIGTGASVIVICLVAAGRVRQSRSRSSLVPAGDAVLRRELGNVAMADLRGGRGQIGQRCERQ